MKASIYKYIAPLVLAAVMTAQAEPFEKIKTELSQAGGISIHFLSLLESTVFETVDSFPGHAQICADGRYRLEIGPDTYIYNGTELFSYTPGNNQVTVEQMSADNSTGEQITFIARLNDHFVTQPLKQKGSYRLVRKETAPESLPDSMTVALNSKLDRISQISYFDINEELNRILIDSIMIADSCSQSYMVPNFPDSVETVRLF